MEPSGPSSWTSGASTDDNLPTSPVGGALTLVQSDPDWQPIFHASNQVVLYNPTSHALSIRPSGAPRSLTCPLCKRPMETSFDGIAEDDEAEVDGIIETERDPTHYSRAANYFQLLAVANDTVSRPPSPHSITSGDGSPSTARPAFSAEAMADGYFNTFFKEERRLGMGANGSVYLCQHLLDGNPLGYFAVKKIAVGESHSYLVKILREVRLLERLHHPNIITYHHAWLETSQFSSFGPKIPTLHVLMQWADGGSLDDFIDARLGRPTKHYHIHPVGPLSTPIGGSRYSRSSATASPGPSGSPYPPNGLVSASEFSDQHSRSARIRAFRAFQRAPPEEKEKMKRQAQNAGLGGKRDTWTPVHLLSAEEVKSLFKDVVDGLAFLHDRSILHLDLKPGNVLLTWDEGSLIPRAMLSDFGTSRDMLHSSSNRSGNTGTLEYTSPESLPSPSTGLLNQIDSKADMWSLGMILHKLLFFKLPYRYASVGDGNGEPIPDVSENEKMDRLEKEILAYAGFKSSSIIAASFETRRLPRAFLVLLESLLNVSPVGRPSSERVITAIREGKLDPLRATAAGTSIVSVAPKRANVPASRLSSVHSDISIHTVGVNDSSQQTGVSEEDDPHTPTANEKDPPLELTDDPSTNAVGRSRLSSPLLWTRSLLLKRTIKSSLLAMKVFHASTLCPHRVHTVPLTIILSAAIMDTWFDDYWITAFFGLFHFAAIKIACLGGTCCTT